jgi:hypothetical protein
MLKYMHAAMWQLAIVLAQCTNHVFLVHTHSIGKKYFSTLYFNIPRCVVFLFLAAKQHRNENIFSSLFCYRVRNNILFAYRSKQHFIFIVYRTTFFHSRLKQRFIAITFE